MTTDGTWGAALASEYLQGGLVAYGNQILVTVSRELTADYRRGFSHSELTRMVKFAQAFPDEANVVTLRERLHQAVRSSTRWMVLLDFCGHQPVVLTYRQLRSHSGSWTQQRRTSDLVIVKMERLDAHEEGAETTTGQRVTFFGEATRRTR